jgi:hypothetical protein
LILMLPLVEPMPGQPSLLVVRNKPSSLTELAGQVKSFPVVVSLIFNALFFAFTFVYFKHRWGLIGKVNDPVPN